MPAFAVDVVTCPGVKLPQLVTTPTGELRFKPADAERVAARVAQWPWWKRGGSLFTVQLTCCGRDAGRESFGRWEDADAFREGYLSGPGVGLPTETRFGGGGHSRSAIIVSGGPPASENGA